MIIDFIVFLFLFFVGYWTGKSANIITDTQKYSKDYLHKLIKMSQEETPTGQIKPKTAQEIQERSLPVKIREGRQAMRETLDNSPELATRRKLIEEWKGKTT